VKYLACTLRVPDCSHKT